MLEDNFGIRALRNPNGSISYRLKKEIKSKGIISRTLGYLPQMSMKGAI